MTVGNDDCESKGMCDSLTISYATGKIGKRLARSAELMVGVNFKQPPTFYVRNRKGTP